MDWKEKYEALFNHVVSVKYGRPIDFPAIERKVSHLRDGDAIRYEDLETIAREDLWPFKKYWMWPAREQIEDKLEDSWGVIINPAAEWDDEEDMIGRLLDIFKHISLMSILLRFVWPEHYAIYSRPSLKVLHIERGYDDVEEYLNFVEEMRGLRFTLGVERTADVDMLIWAITQAKDEFEEIKALINERLPGELPLADLLKHAASRPIRLAEAYFGAGDFQTAGFWTTRAFERVLRGECIRQFGYVPKNTEREYGDIEFLIRSICEARNDEELQDLMLDMKNLRNATIHVNRPFNSQMAAEFIKGVKAVEALIENIC